MLLKITEENEMNLKGMQTDMLFAKNVAKCLLSMYLTGQLMN